MPKGRSKLPEATYHSWSKLALHYYIKTYIQFSSTSVYKRVLFRLLTTTGSDQISLKLTTLSPTFLQ